MSGAGQGAQEFLTEMGWAIFPWKQLSWKELQPGMEVVSILILVLVSVLVPGLVSVLVLVLAPSFKGFPVLILSNFTKTEQSPDLDLLDILSKDSPSSKGQRLEEHPWTC